MKIKFAIFYPSALDEVAFNLSKMQPFSFAPIRI